MEKNNQQTESKPTFLTVVEVPEHRVSVYITNEQIVVQDFDDKTNGLIVPFTQFKAHGNTTATENVDNDNNAESGK